MAKTAEVCKKNAEFVKQSLEDAGFVFLFCFLFFFINIENSVFSPTQTIEWIGITWDSKLFLLKNPRKEN